MLHLLPAITQARRTETSLFAAGVLVCLALTGSLQAAELDRREAVFELKKVLQAEIMLSRIAAPEQPVPELSKRLLANNGVNKILIDRRISYTEFIEALKIAFREENIAAPPSPLSEEEFRSTFMKVEREFSVAAECLRPEASTTTDEVVKALDLVSTLVYKPRKPFLRVVNHPYYGTTELEKYDLDDFLTGFDPRTINTRNQTNPKELAAQFRPQSPAIPFNAEQILKGRLFEMSPTSIEAINLNADLGLQKTLSTILRRTVISTASNGNEEPSFVILSHGHSIAGLAELVKMTRQNPSGQIEYLFDTSIYMPMGKWDANEPRVVAAATERAQIWGDLIEKTKREYRNKGIKCAGGIAIALNGHRGDWALNRMSRTDTANVDAKTMLGKPEVFKRFLQSRGLHRVVIITEHPVPDRKKVNRMTLSGLKQSDAPDFDASNQDLYDYMKRLQELGVDVQVVSGEQRSEPKNPRDPWIEQQ